MYYKDRSGNWVPIDPEIVHIKSGGFIKSTVTHGIIKVDQNGRINGPQSKLALQRRYEFLIYVPEGVSANEYDLLRFRLHSDSREFRMLTGGVFHSTGGASGTRCRFTPVRLRRERTSSRWTIRLAAASSAFCHRGRAM